MEMNLIYKEAHRGCWTGLPLDERIGIASLAACEAEKHFDPSRGRYSTLAVTSIRNAFASELAKEKTRMKYDGVQASCLEPSQIPAANCPDPERQAIFRDALAKLPADAKLLANLALHTPKAVVANGENVLKGLEKELADRGWTSYRFNQARAAIRTIL